MAFSDRVESMWPVFAVTVILIAVGALTLPAREEPGVVHNEGACHIPAESNVETLPPGTIELRPPSFFQARTRGAGWTDATFVACAPGRLDVEVPGDATTTNVQDYQIGILEVPHRFKGDPDLLWSIHSGTDAFERGPDAETESGGLHRELVAGEVVRLILASTRADLIIAVQFANTTAPVFADLRPVWNATPNPQTLLSFPPAQYNPGVAPGPGLIPSPQAQTATTWSATLDPHGPGLLIVRAWNSGAASDSRTGPYTDAVRIRAWDGAAWQPLDRAGQYGGPGSATTTYLLRDTFVIPEGKPVAVTRHLNETVSSTLVDGTQIGVGVLFIPLEPPVTRA